MKAPLSAAASEKDILGIISRHQNKPGALLGILEEVQEKNRYKYLPRETLEFVAGKTGTPLSRIYGVTTFYSFFNLKPQGDHTILVCRGTACHTRGSRMLLEDAACMLGCAGFLESGEPSFTTPDNRFTIKTVACFGQCALSPVIAIDGVIHSRVTAGAFKTLIEKLMKGGKRS
jgi:NADH-quinone oxidoreductase subunit E